MRFSLGQGRVRWIVVLLVFAVLGVIMLALVRGSHRSEEGVLVEPPTATESERLEGSPPRGPRRSARSSPEPVADLERQEHALAPAQPETTASAERRVSQIEVLFKFEDRDRGLLGALAAREIGLAGLRVKLVSGATSTTHSVVLAERGRGRVAATVSYRGTFPVAAEVSHGTAVLASVAELAAGDPLVVPLEPLSRTTTEVRFRAVEAGEPLLLTGGSVTRRSDGDWTQLHPQEGGWFATLAPELYDYSVTAMNGAKATGAVDAALEREVVVEFWPAIALAVEFGPLEDAAVAMLSPKSPLALADRPHPVRCSETGSVRFEQVQPGPYSLSLVVFDMTEEHLTLRAEAYEIRVEPSPVQQTQHVQRLAGTPAFSRRLVFPGCDQGLLRWRDERGRTLYHGPAPSNTTLLAHSAGECWIELAPIVSTADVSGPDMTAVRRARVELLATPPAGAFAID
ncbi:MAG: hypothetical protein WD226_01990 [Planctomycetota bacterium]